MAPSVEPTLISLFAGAGGMDLGLERAGWQTVAATDLDGSCVETLRASQAAEIPIAGDEGRTHLGGAKIIQADIRDLSGADLSLDPWIRVADDLLRVDDLGWHETVLGRWPGVQCARLLVVGWCRCGGAGGWCVPVGSPARW
jgi:hypothetical protein